MQLFQKDKRSKVKGDHAELSSGDVNKLLSDMWKNASAVTKAPYEDKAKVSNLNVGSVRIEVHTLRPCFACI